LIVACVASGPSLTQEDCEYLERANIKTIAVNSSWRAVPWCQMIYAGDQAWWDAHKLSIKTKSELWTCSARAAEVHGLNFHRASGGYSSGLRAIELAISLGADKVILLGYDCSIEQGTHWHGDHTQTKNPTAQRCKVWAKQFAAMDRKGVDIVNCSRQTELKCFRRDFLENAIC